MKEILLKYYKYIILLFLILPTYKLYSQNLSPRDIDIFLKNDLDLYYFLAVDFFLGEDYFVVSNEMRQIKNSLYRRDFSEENIDKFIDTFKKIINIDVNIELNEYF